MGRAIGRFFGAGAKLSAYDGASRSRLRESWTVTNPGPNAAADPMTRSYLVGRSRDGERNDPHCARVLSIFVNNLIGTGLDARAKFDEDDEASKVAAKEADAWWSEVAAYGGSDIESDLTMAGQQEMEAGSLGRDGEVLVRFIIDPERTPLPFCFQIIECDMLDESKQGDMSEGRYIRSGVEYASSGRIVAYWIRRSHPGELDILSLGSIRIPKEDCFHLKLPRRPGQARAVPLLASVLRTKRDLNEFEEATIAAKKNESCVVGVIEKEPYSEHNPAPEYDEQDDEEAADVFPAVLNAEGKREARIRPNTWVGVENGAKVTFNNPQLSNNYDGFKRSHLQSFAMGANVSYEQASGDFSGANYSTMRGGLLEFWTWIERIRWNAFAPLQEWKWKKAMEVGFILGRVRTAVVGAEWQAPARQSIEPDKDAIGDYLRVRAGWIDEDDVIAGHGYHPAELREKIAKNQKIRADKGIVVDTDPTKYAWRGAFPPAVQATPLADQIPPGSESAPAPTPANALAMATAALAQAVAALAAQSASRPGDGT